MPVWGQWPWQLPSAIAVANWFADVAAGGPTAVRSIAVAVRWLQGNMGFTGPPLESPLLRGASVPHPERVLCQAMELPLRAWSQYSLQAASSTGTLRLPASLILYKVFFKYAQCHAFQHRMCGVRALAGRVSKGKVLRGATFYVAPEKHFSGSEKLALELQRLEAPKSFFEASKINFEAS